MKKPPKKRPHKSPQVIPDYIWTAASGSMGGGGTGGNSMGAMINAPAPPTPQYGAPFDVSISFPESVVIKMVDASALMDYEFSMFFSSVFCTGAIGFLVAWLQSEENGGAYGVMSLILGLSSIGFFVWGLLKRKKMTAESKSFKLKTSGVEEIINGEK
jgi:hypothetical protein